ncbi:unnamed protein product [Allacma fusca]|uniref:glutathione transferase n=2 Tax=Allacma fusca TaxID=39272 RepID=A0A8J2PXX3_9HEXA|nr:unnamed protein product [Allacma fusca]
MEVNDSTHYELYYYNSRGLAEPIRFLLSYGGASFDDIRTPVTCFSPITPLPEEWRASSLFGQVPILKFDNKQLTQSLAITRYLARKYKLVGKDDFEAAKCDELADGIKEFFLLWTPFYFEEDEDEKKKLAENTFLIAKQRYLTTFNSVVEANDGVHLVGNAITWPDIYLAEYLDHIARITGLDLVSEYSGLEALLKNVLSNPRIKDWLERRPNTPY